MPTFRLHCDSNAHDQHNQSTIFKKRKKISLLTDNISDEHLKRAFNYFQFIKRRVHMTSRE